MIEREGGRGHWGRCYSVVLAGAGFVTGTVLECAGGANLTVGAIR